MSPQAEPGDRPRIRDILTAEEMEGMARDAGMSAEQLAKVLAPLSRMSSSAFQASMAAGATLGRALGLASKGSAELALACSYTAAVRGLVFALTSLKYGLTTAFDTPAGAYVEAELPRDFLSHPGTLQFDIVELASNSIQLSGVSEVKGQMYDWGKGKRALNDVFEKTELFARRLGG